MTDYNIERLYKRSWIDRFNNWVEKLPVQAWIFYVLFGIMLILVQVLFLWSEGGLQAEELLPVIVFNGFATPFLLALVHLLDNQVVTAMNSIRPMLDTTASEFDQYKYKISNMPFLAPLVAGLILLIFSILMERLWITPIRYVTLEQLPVFTVVYQVTDKSSAFLYGVFFYHTIRQLRLVNAINLNLVQVNLFNLKPLLAFSRLTASTAVGLLVGVYVWMLINPDLLADPVSIGFAALFTIMAVIVFVWPLWGVHRLMEMEKERALHEIDLRFEAVFSELNRRILEEDYAATERLSKTISSLDIQYKRISAIPTWPWRSETARIALTAIALPLLLMIIQYFVLQALN